MANKSKKNNLEKLNICQVTLKGNIPTIKDNIIMLKKFYPDFKLFIICPKKDIGLFKKHINNDCCEIINEENIISFRKFTDIANKYFKKNSYYNEIQNRLGWYYQQVLKITFMIDFVIKKREPILMWDADAILLKKFVFFESDKTIKYGTTFEFHRAYFKTNEKILKKLPEYFLAMTNQFIGLTPVEGKFLVRNFNKIKKKTTDTSLWISNIISWAISDTHKNFNGSMLSEQELIGHSNLLYSYEKQKLIHGIRAGLSGKLNHLQKKVLTLLGYNYVCYEYSHQTINGKNMLERNQSWLSFIKLVFKKTSNKTFRGVKHYLKFI